MIDLLVALLKPGVRRCAMGWPVIILAVLMWVGNARAADFEMEGIKADTTISPNPVAPSATTSGKLKLHLFRSGTNQTRETTPPQDSEITWAVVPNSVYFWDHQGDETKTAKKIDFPGPVVFSPEISLRSNDDKYPSPVTTLTINPSDRHKVPEAKLWSTPGRYSFLVTATISCTIKNINDPKYFGPSTSPPFKVEIEVARSIVLEVKYGGDRDKFFDVLDDNGKTYGTPVFGYQWYDHSRPPKGNVSDEKDFDSPLCYRRSAKTQELKEGAKSFMNVRAITFYLVDPTVIGPATDISKIRVKGIGPSLEFPITSNSKLMSFPSHAVKIYHHDGGLTCLQLDFPTKERRDGSQTDKKEQDEWQADTPFDDRIAYFDHFKITWEVSFDNEKTWQWAGETDNPVYVIRSAPDPKAILYYTALHVSTVGAKTATNCDEQQQVVDAIWSQFAKRNIQRMTAQNGTKLPKVVPDYLSYYRDWDVQPDVIDIPAFMGKGDAQCGSWAAFFLDTLAIQGYKLPKAGTALTCEFKSNRVVVANWFFVGQWNFAGAATGDGSYLNKFGAAFYVGGGPGKNGYVWQRGAPVTDHPTIPAQNNADPLSVFPRHQVVKIGNDYYDPSYGTIYKGGLTDLENEMGGFGRQNPLVGGAASFSIWPNPRAVGVVDFFPNNTWSFP